jgi:hypothetical protein
MAGAQGAPYARLMVKIPLSPPFTKGILYLTNPTLLLVGNAEDAPAHFAISIYDLRDRRPLPWRSWMPEESQVESCEHQDNANIRYQPFPESVSEEREI